MFEDCLGFGGNLGVKPDVSLGELENFEIIKKPQFEQQQKVLSTHFGFLAMGEFFAS